MKKKLDLLEKTVGSQYAEMYLGGYGDFDSFAYNCCKKYKQTHPDTLLVFVTPYITVEYQRSTLDYQKLRYDTIIYPEIENRPLKFAITYRNKWMVDKADFLICAIEHEYGGAYKTYRYAKTQKKQIFNITGSQIM
ncbi:MAG: hypothetical protein IJY04_08595 [Clostridia bacterium]|nr:hypothetical protein [Clostridia bacterium]